MTWEAFLTSTKNVVVDRGLLSADCKKKNGEYVSSTINLDEKIGNLNGNFVLSSQDHARGKNFSETSSEVRYHKPVLEATLRTDSGDWNTAHVSLNTIIANEDGKLIWLPNML